MLNRVFAVVSVGFGLAWSGLSYADQFVLYDAETGEEYGPFVYSNESKITINDRSYEIRRLNTAGDELAERLKSIIVPRLEFRHADVRDIVAFMRDASEMHDPGRKGANIVLSRIHGQHEQDHTTPVVNRDDPWGLATPAAPRPPEPRRITLSLRRVSLYDALSIIAELADLHYRIDERGVVFLEEGDR